MKSPSSTSFFCLTSPYSGVVENWNDIRSNPVVRPPRGCNEGARLKAACCTACFIVNEQACSEQCQRRLNWLLRAYSGQQSSPRGCLAQVCVGTLVCSLLVRVGGQMQGMLAQARISIAHSALGCSQLRGQGDASRA
jgi:hypothetical protein